MSVTTSISSIDTSENEPDLTQARINTKVITIPASVVEISDNLFENSIVENIIFMGDSQLKTIGKYAFKNCKFLKSIQIPASVVEIADEAFFESSLEEIVFTHDSQLKTIGKAVFRECKFLKSITIPDAVTHIESNSFRNSAIEKVLFGDNSQCATIGDDAFRECHFLKSIEIPSSVLKIGDTAFSDSSIQTVVFKDGSKLEIIGEYAFANCKSLESFKVPSSVIVIGYAAFSESIIKEILFSDDPKLEILSEYIFEKCPSLKSITIPASILEIGEFAFAESGIEEVLFPDNSNLNTIGKAAFKDCQFLKSITIPDSVTYIGLDSFNNAAIEEVLFGVNSQCTTIGESAFRECKSLESIKIPPSVLKIGNSAFFGSSIQTVVFTNDSRLESIDEFAFENCKSLESIKIPSSVVVIDYAAFSESNIKEVIFSDDSKLEILSDFIFEKCVLLKSITLPASIVEIGESAFSESGIEEIIFSDNSNLKTIRKGAFHQARLSKPIQIPMSVVEIGEVAFKQCFFTEIVFAEKSKLKTIHLGAFIYCRFGSIKIPDSVVTIAERAFAGCDKLEEVLFSVNSQLETIGEAAFLECSSLKSFIFPQSLRKIGNFAFSNCSLPKSITLFSTAVEFLGDPFTKSGVEEVIFGNSGKTQTTEKSNHFLQLCKEGDFRKCKEYLENNDVNFSYSRHFTEDSMSIAMDTKNVDLITLLIKNKALVYSKCETRDIEKCFTDDIFEDVFFESATVFWYSIYSFVMRKMYKFIRRLLKLLRSKEYVEEWVNIFKNFHQITPLQCVTQGDSFDLYLFLIDCDLVKLADLQVKTIETYFHLAFKFGNVAILKKSLEVLPIDNVSIKFSDFLMLAPQDKLYSLVEYTLPYILKNEDPFGFVIEGEYDHGNFVRFPETVLSYLAYAQAFDAFKYIIENVPNTQYTPSHLVACSLFRGYNDTKHKADVDIRNFMKLFDYILQDDIRPRVLGEDKEWIGKSIFTCIKDGSSEMCMKLFSYGFDRDDIYIDVISEDHRHSFIRYSLLSYACRYQSREVVQYLIDAGVCVDGLLPNHPNCSSANSNKDEQNCINIVYEDEGEDETRCESGSEDKHMNGDDSDDDYDDDYDDDSDDKYSDVTDPEKYVFLISDLEDAWFEPYFNPYRLNRNQDVEIYYFESKPFDPSTEDPLVRFLERRPRGYLTLLNVTPLGAAIYARNLSLVRLLLKNGANPNANTFSGFPHLFVLGAGEVINLRTNISIKSPGVEYPVIDVPSDIQDKQETKQMKEQEKEEQEKGKKIKIQNRSEDEDVSVSISVPDTEFAIFQELVNHGTDLLHEQTVYYAYDGMNLREFNIHDLCAHLNYSLNLLKYLQNIPQLGDKIKKYYIDSFHPTVMDFCYEGDAFFSVDTVDYMFQNGYLSFETYKEDEEFQQAITSIDTYYQKGMKLVLEKYGFHFANLSNEIV